MLFLPFVKFSSWEVNPSQKEHQDLWLFEDQCFGGCVPNLSQLCLEYLEFMYMRAPCRKLMTAGHSQQMDKHVLFAFKSFLTINADIDMSHYSQLSQRLISVIRSFLETSQDEVSSELLLWFLAVMAELSEIRSRRLLPDRQFSLKH